MKADIKIMTKIGGVSAKMQHALDQVHNWLHVSDEHRLALLDCIGLKREEVSKIRGIVILGKDYIYNSDHLRRLKSYDYGRIDFFTYDDLLRNMVTLIRSIREL